MVLLLTSGLSLLKITAQITLCQYRLASVGLPVWFALQGNFANSGSHDKGLLFPYPWEIPNQHNGCTQIHTSRIASASSS